MLQDPYQSLRVINLRVINNVVGFDASLAHVFLDIHTMANVVLGCTGTSSTRYREEQQRARSVHALRSTTGTVGAPELAAST